MTGTETHPLCTIPPRRNGTISNVGNGYALTHLIKRATFKSCSWRRRREEEGEEEEEEKKKRRRRKV